MTAMEIPPWKTGELLLLIQHTRGDRHPDGGDVFFLTLCFSPFSDKLYDVQPKEPQHTNYEFQ